MPALDPVTLITPRLILRPLTEADVPALFAIFSHPDVMRYWSYPALTDITQAQEMIQRIQASYREGSAVRLGIERRSDGALVGTCALFNVHASSRRAEIGYALARETWGAGVMHEALTALVAHAFTALDLHRLEADIDPRNTASARTLERLGFQKEGHLRERWIVDGEISDTVWYGLLKREWENGHAANAQATTIRQLYTQYERIQAASPDVRREVLPNLIRQIPVTAGDRGAVIYSQLDAAGADAAIQAQIAYFEQLGCDFEWKHYDYDTPPDLKARLAAHGFELEETETIMALPLATAPAALLQPVTHDVRRIHDPDELDAIQRIKTEVWGEERDFVTQFLRLTLTQTPERMSIYIAYAGELPVSCGWIYFPTENPFASLWGGSTLAEHRKQGFYTALLAIRVQEAIARGKQYLTIDASPMSRPIVERFGFVRLAESTPCIWQVRRR